MILRKPAEQKAREKEIEGATFHNFNDVQTLEGTGVGPLEKGVKYPRVHKLTAKVLVDKKYATVVP